MRSSSVPKPATSGSSPHLGGIIERCDPPPGAVELAQAGARRGAGARRLMPGSTSSSATTATLQDHGAGADRAGAVPRPCARRRRRASPRDPVSRRARAQIATGGSPRSGSAAVDLEPRGVDLRDQRIDRQPRSRAAASSARQNIGSRLIEVWMAGDQHRAFDRRRVIRPLHQYMCWPPLIDSVEPVMKPPFSSTRKATPRAISSALPSRPTGILATILPSTSSGTAATMSVSI